MDQTPNTGRRDRDLETIGTAVTLGFGIAVSLAALAGGGIWLDQRFDTAPMFALLGLAFGLFAAGYQLYELALLSQKDRENGPIGRAIGRRVSPSTRTRTHDDQLGE